ncbi:MAG: sigma 54-interacting transcriptional regulator [Acidobacteria bacterium]|nr:sigma 54-interacting transcriptional regulator [Acidobacteriota bacterium]
MSPPPTPRLDFTMAKALLLEMAQQRSISSLMRLIVRRLATNPQIALARIWLIFPGDICPQCPMREECPDRTRCLHLIASAGTSLLPDRDWSRLDGQFRRFPLGVRKIGRIATTAESFILVDMADTPEWITRPEWVHQEQIEAFVGQPLLSKGEVLGVLAIFARTRDVEDAVDWLRLVADHAAVSLSNARVFEEIEHLRRHLELENLYLREELNEARAFGEIVGQSSALHNTLQKIEMVAPTDASVLILGESGTGKELVAREIHRRSRRSEGPLIKVNCASVPRELYESEFFGHVKGAFTGAVKDRSGRFEAADHGTLFLDEVGEIPLDLQGKLLRVLQEGQYERVGEEVTREVDVRIIAATNRDLQRDVMAGQFRQDLYYRINVFPIEVAPLRRRKEDIPLLTRHFLDLAARKFNVPPPRLTQANILELQHYDWPGNVRELQNVIERAVITAVGGALRLDLPRSTGEAAPAPVLGNGTAGPADEPAVIPEVEMRRRERENIRQAMIRCGWQIYGADGAAELLGIKPTTLASRLKKFGLKKPVESGG